MTESAPLRIETSTPELALEQAELAYQLCGQVVHTKVEKLLELLPAKDQASGRHSLKMTLAYQAIDALIATIQSENPHTQPVPHLVIENVRLFVNGQQSRIEAMTKAVLEYLQQTYPQLEMTDFASDTQISGLVPSPATSELEKVA